MLSKPLITWTVKGLYCEAGDFYIDPHRAVEKAIVTHAHSDHARKGSKSYICARSSVGLLKCRLGPNIHVEGKDFDKSFRLGAVEVSLHPAGHILGSAQVRVQHGNEVWVASGDFKREPDPSCEPFQSVRCDTFITEATFGTPKYQWDKNREHGNDISAWWKKNAADGRNSLLFGYSLGKAQRILAELATCSDEVVHVHESILAPTQCYRDEGRKLVETVLLGTRPLKGALILAPPSILKTDFIKDLGDYQTAFASGWMQGASNYGQRAYDCGFVMSDHADWKDLNKTIDETGASQVFVQHRDGVLIRHLRKKGLSAHAVEELVPGNFARLECETLPLF